MLSGEIALKNNHYFYCRGCRFQAVVESRQFVCVLVKGCTAPCERMARHKNQLLSRKKMGGRQFLSDVKT